MVGMRKLLVSLFIVVVFVMSSGVASADIPTSLDSINRYESARCKPGETLVLCKSDARKGINECMQYYEDDDYYRLARVGNMSSTSKYCKITDNPPLVATFIWNTRELVKEHLLLSFFIGSSALYLLFALYLKMSKK